MIAAEASDRAGDGASAGAATASAAPTTTTAGYIFPATLIVACLALEARAPHCTPSSTLRRVNHACGVAQSSGFLDGDSPLNSSPAKPCGFHVTYGVLWGI